MLQTWQWMVPWVVFCISFPICICICFCICICRQYTFIQSSKVADTIGESQVAQPKVASPELLWLTIFLSIFVLVSVSVLVFYQYLHISVFESVSGPPGTGAGSFDLRSTQNWKYLRFCHKNICQLYQGKYLTMSITTQQRVFIISIALAMLF